MASGFQLPRYYQPSLTPTSVPGVSPEALSNMAVVSKQAPRIPWDTFIDEFFTWKNGEHIGMIGPTGQGKTTLMEALLPLHKYVTVFATKPRDESMDYLIRNRGYKKFESWPNGLDADEAPRRVIWPDARQIDAQARQTQVFRDAFGKIYRETNWTLALDETYVLDELLGLSKEIRVYLTQARSLGISLIAATQRPAWVPRELYTSSTHLFFWRSNDRTDLQSIAGIGDKDSLVIRMAVANLDRYQALYINTRTGEMARTKAPAPNY